eukprot:3440848-Amphidinium_carterae.1
MLRPFAALLSIAFGGGSAPTHSRAGVSAKYRAFVLNCGRLRSRSPSSAARVMRRAGMHMRPETLFSDSASWDLHA